MDFIRKTSDGYYEVRIAVPGHLRPVLKVANLTKRLGTKSRAEAKRKAPEQVTAFRKRLSDAELRLTRPTLPFDVRAALQAIDLWAHAERQRALPETFSSGLPSALSVAFNWEERWRPTPEGYAPTKVMIDPADAALLTALKRGGFSVSPETTIPKALRDAFARTCGILETEIEQTSHGSRQFIDRLNTSSLVPPAARSTQDSGVTISGAFQKWRAKREKGGRDAGKSAREFETQIKRFIDVHGDMPLRAVTRAQCIEFRDLMSRYPARPTKAQRQRSVREVVKECIASQQRYSPLSPKTLNEKVFAAAKAVFSATLDDEQLPNPMAQIAIDEGQTTPSRVPYEAIDLQALFGSAIFVGKPTSKPAAAGAAQKWVPLLAAYTGARLEELAQLAVADIKQQDGIHRIHFQERYDGPDPGYLRSLKNTSSNRLVPLHSALLQLGFLDFVDRQRAAGEVHLFPNMKWSETKKRDKSVKVSERFTGWWATYSRAIVPDKDKSFHSLRHTFVGRLRDAGVPDSIAEALTGHAPAGQNGNYGRSKSGARYKLPALAAAIEKLDYPEINLADIR